MCRVNENVLSYVEFWVGYVCCKLLTFLLVVVKKLKTYLSLYRDLNHLHRYALQTHAGNTKNKQALCETNSVVIKGFYL